MSNIRLKYATSNNELKIAADLFREYQQFLGEDLCFQGFEAELASLPGKYAEPHGAILLAFDGDTPVGCVAVRPIDKLCCEMKRLYVKPQTQRTGTGKKLAKAIIAKAKSLGYQKMQLDTLQRLSAALHLYNSLGFQAVEPYYANPLDEVVYMELDLIR